MGSHFFLPALLLRHGNARVTDHRTQMQGRFNARMFNNNKQVEDLQTEQNQGAVKILSTLLNN